MKKLRVQKLITFSPQLYTLVDGKAKKLGVTFPEYIRSLALEDLKDSDEYIVANAEMERQIGVAQRELEANLGIVLDPEKPEELAKMFDQS